MSEEQEQLDYEAHNAKVALDLNKAQQEIERLNERIAKLEEKGGEMLMELLRYKGVVA